MTPFTNIYSRATIVMGDYKIAKLKSINVQMYYEYMRSLLIEGIELFTGCLQSLDYISQEEVDVEDGTVTVWYFSSDLTPREQSILAKTIVIKWWEQKIQDVTVFQGSIPEKNFAKMDIANGLKQKSEYKDKLNQELYQLINEYQGNNLIGLDYFGGV